MTEPLWPLCHLNTECILDRGHAQVCADAEGQPLLSSTSPGVRRPSVVIRRNSGGLLVGLSWSHYKHWPTRKTHLYIGWWVLTITTKSKHSGEKEAP